MQPLVADNHPNLPYVPPHHNGFRHHVPRSEHRMLWQYHRCHCAHVPWSRPTCPSVPHQRLPKNLPQSARNWRDVTKIYFVSGAVCISSVSNRVNSTTATYQLSSSKF